MKTYIMTKIINAVPAKMVNGCVWPEGLPLPEKAPEVPVPSDCRCGDTCGALPVRIEDGYVYTVAGEEYPWTQWMSKEEFEKVCRTAENMAFGDALEALKSGARISREGWNGKGMYVFLADNVEFVTEADISEFHGLEEGVEVSEVLVLRTAQGTLQPGWLATQSDMLAEDWKIVE